MKDQKVQVRKSGDRLYFDYLITLPNKATQKKRKWLPANLTYRKRDAYIKSFLAELDREYNQPPAKPVISLKKALEDAYALKKRDIRHKTHATYISHYRMLLKWATAHRLLYKPVDAFSKAHAITWLDYIQQTRNISNKTWNDYQSWGSGIFNIMLQREWITENPFRNIPRKRVSKKKTNLLSAAEYEQYMDYLKEHARPLYTMAMLIRTTLARPYELVRLRVRNFDFDRQTVYIPAALSKTKQDRIPVIASSLMPVLEYLADAPADNFWFGPDGWPSEKRHIYRTQLFDWHRQVLQDMGLADREFTLYKNKHMGALRMVQAGVHPVVIRDQAGHTSVRTTEIYLHSIQMDQAAYESLKSL